MLKRHALLFGLAACSAPVPMGCRLGRYCEIQGYPWVVFRNSDYFIDLLYSLFPGIVYSISS